MMNMMKKLKLYGLISLFVMLASCDESCGLHFYYLLDSGRFVYIATPIGILGLGPTGPFILEDVSAIEFVWLVAQTKYVGAPFPFFDDSVSRTPHVITSNKPAMWAVSSTQNAVYLIDSNTDNLAGKVAVGQAPTSAVFSPDNTLLYVTNSGSDSISVIDTTTGKVSTIAVNPGSKPTRAAVTPDGTSLFVLNSGQNSVSQVDTAARKVVATFAVGQGPTSVAVTPDGLLIYVCNGKDNTVTVYDVLTLEQVQTVTGITNPTSLAFTIDGTTAYITSGVPSGLLYSLRTKSYRLGKTPIQVGNNPVFVTLDTYNTLIYVTNKGSNNLTIINGGDRSIAGTVSLGGSPSAVISLP